MHNPFKWTKNRLIMEKVLLIKTGYSEMLEEKNNSRKVSYGDVLRTTPLLELYSGKHVTWVTDIEAFPLLEGNPRIHALLPYDFTTAFQLQSEEFDSVINLEKVPGICALADRIRARRNRFGFTFNSQTGSAEAYDRAFEILTVGAGPDVRKSNRKTIQKLLFETVGEKWKGEKYSLGYKPTTREHYDIALNTQAGQKWPTKMWPIENWMKLEDMLFAAGFKVTRQDAQPREVLTDLRKYIDWINSARIVVTNDSLGLHLGIALEKYVIGLFGPTSDSEVYFYDKGESILSESKCKDFPCFRDKCKLEETCMGKITTKQVFERIKKYTENGKEDTS